MLYWNQLLHKILLMPKSVHSIRTNISQVIKEYRNLYMEKFFVHGMTFILILHHKSHVPKDLAFPMFHITSASVRLKIYRT